MDPTRVNEFGTSQEMLEENGDATRAITEKPEDTPNEKGDNNTDTKPKSEEDEVPAEPKSPEEKKND